MTRKENDMDAIKAYFENLKEILEKIIQTQSQSLHRGAELICNAVLNGNNIFAFGCSHAGLLALELYYRTGGMALVNPIKAPGLNLDVDPATMTSQIERLPEYGRIIIDNQPIRSGDILIIHSVSGRNTVTVDAAIRAREIGATVIALTSLATAEQVKSRHLSGKSLHHIADLVLDNCGCLGDASLVIPGVPEKVAPTSTAIGAAILNAMIAQAVVLITEAGMIAPVFVSANLDHGDKHNKAMLAQYKSHIFYMGHNK
ncbi:MAG: SIS domain-containing protein [Clostridiaceae bacterium]|nr:SIS domain-containing protein [Clostridiaceae bacterium]